MSDHPFNAINADAVAAAERAYAEHGMAEAIRVALKEATSGVRKWRGHTELSDIDLSKENRDVINVLYSAGRLQPVETA